MKIMKWYFRGHEERKNTMLKRQRPIGTLDLNVRVILKAIRIQWIMKLSIITMEEIGHAVMRTPSKIHINLYAYSTHKTQWLKFCSIGCASRAEFQQCQKLNAQITESTFCSIHFLTKQGILSKISNLCSLFSLILLLSSFHYKGNCFGIKVLTLVW